jgi:hypothetical protein
MTRGYRIAIVDQYKYHWGVNVGLSIAGPSGEFPLLVGCSLRTPKGEVRDLPAKWLTSPGLALWHFNVDHEFKSEPQDPFSSVRGEIIFALWRDNSFTERLCDTGWIRWTAPWLRGASAAGLDMQEAEIQSKYKDRLNVWRPR